MKRMCFRVGWRSVLAVLVVLPLSLQALDRWAALSQIESGDNDAAVGAAGEISRYQVKPDVWRRHADADANWRKAADAKVVAERVMRERCTDFEQRFGHPPTDFEFYILWNAPAQVAKPSRAVRRRAERFSNLVASP